MTGRIMNACKRMKILARLVGRGKPARAHPSQAALARDVRCWSMARWHATREHGALTRGDRAWRVGTRLEMLEHCALARGYGTLGCGGAVARGAFLHATSTNLADAVSLPADGTSMEHQGTGSSAALTMPTTTRASGAASAGADGGGKGGRVVEVSVRC